MGNIALVCRRWSRICQEKIFQETWIRSKQDYLDLWSFVNRPQSIIPSCVHVLFLIPNIAFAPWIHNVCIKIAPRMLRPDFTIVLTLESRNGNPLSPGRSIHSSLPRQPLPNASLRIARLHLAHVHFRKLENLARLVGEMPSLQKLDCFHVTWPSLPQEDEMQPRGEQDILSDPLPNSVTSRSTNLIDYRMEQCTDDSAVVLLSCQILPTTRPRLSVEDINAIWGMVGSFYEVWQYGIRSQFLFDDHSGSGGQCSC